MLTGHALTSVSVPYHEDDIARTIAKMKAGRFYIHADLYEEYCAIAGRAKRAPVSREWFGRALVANGKVRRLRASVEGVQCRGWIRDEAS